MTVVLALCVEAAVVRAQCDTKLAALAAGAYRAMRYAEAGRLFHRIFAECPGQATALYNAAGCEEKAGQLEEAKRDFDAYLNVACAEKQSPQCQVAKARSLAIASRMREADLERQLALARAAAAAASESRQHAAPAPGSTPSQSRGELPTRPPPTPDAAPVTASPKSKRQGGWAKADRPGVDRASPSTEIMATDSKPRSNAAPGWWGIAGGATVMSTGIAIYVWNTVRLRELEDKLGRGATDSNDNYAYVSYDAAESTAASIERMDPIAVSLAVAGGAAVAVSVWWLSRDRGAESKPEAKQSMYFTGRSAAFVMRF